MTKLGEEKSSPIYLNSKLVYLQQKQNKGQNIDKKQKKMAMFNWPPCTLRYFYLWTSS